MKRSSTHLDLSRNKALFAEVLGISNPNGRSVFFLVAFLVTLGWMGDTLFLGLQAILGMKSSLGWQLLILGVFPFILVLSWGWGRWKLAQRKIVQLRVSSKAVDPHVGVILFLSHIRNPDHVDRLANGDASVLEADYFSWKPCLRGLTVHQSKLKKVWVICSPESSKQFQWFVWLLQPHFPEVSFECVAQESGINFEEMEGLVQVLEEIMIQLPADMDESDVIIDMTGGQKPASGAAMMVSLMNEAREVQYVQTNAPFGVKTYPYQVSLLGRKVKKQQ